MRLYLRNRSNLFDFAVLNQHGGGREHVSRAGIEQPASFYQNRRGRLGGQLCSSKYSDCERKD